ncbi:MAG: hypothetical protein JWM78_1415 [Verrucomicrobiaceae bacterium]|nr:hypothetical protein [Verrucomicrobiaceae bacterium]
MGPLNAPVADNCFESLGLAFDPFADGVMPAFFFVGGQRRYLAQRAVHTLYFSGGIVLAVGDRGAGKSRWLDEISAELRDIADLCRIEATVLMDSTQIRVLLASAIGLATDSSASAAAFVLALNQNRAGDEEPLPIVVLLDSAHLLSIPALEETVALARSSGGRVRLLLAGESDLAVSWREADTGAAEILQLPALDRQETADYLHTRLQAAGSTVAMPFDSDVLDALFAQTAGNIGSIHAAAPQLLAPAPKTFSVSRSIKALPILHISVIAGLLAIVIILVVYRGGSSANDPSKAVAALPQAGDKHSVALALPSAREADLPKPADIPVTRMERAADQVPALAAKPEPVINPEPVKSAEPAKQPEPPKQPEPAKRPEPKAPEPIVKPAPAKPEVKAIAAPKPTAPVEKESTVTLSADEHELLGLPSQQFVLQLLGAESRSTVAKFAVGAGRGQHLLTYRTQLRGKPWFIVVTGPYPSKAAVQAAIAKMPEPLRKQQPWSRTVGNVQADIKAHLSER